MCNKCNSKEFPCPAETRQGFFLSAIIFKDVQSRYFYAIFAFLKDGSGIISVDTILEENGQKFPVLNNIRNLKFKICILRILT